MACTSCKNSKPCSNPTCGCKFKVDTSCITYSGADLGAAGFVSGDSLTTILTTLNEKFVDYGPGDYVTMTSEAPGANCQYGGIKYLLRNGQTHAIKSTQYLCTASNGLGSGTPNVLTKWGQDGQTLEDSIVSENSTQITVGGTLKVTGGSPGAGKVFTSDSQGVGSWETMSPYDLPISTNTILGGVIVGKNLSITTQGVLSLDMITDVTHAELVALVGSDALEPGTYYRITDYQTIYEQPDFIDMVIPVTTPIIKTGPIQPLIVLALKSNVLSEQAYQEDFPKDTIKYQLVYNTKKTSTPTKGRIYERVDEYNNRTDFDHRNVLFKRYTTAEELFDTVIYWYPFTYDSQPIEVLSFPLDSTTQNVYIEGNWNIKDSQKSQDYYATFFDLPNIVLGSTYGDTYKSGSKIGNCANVTIGEIFSSEIKSIYCSAIKSIIGSTIDISNRSIILLQIAGSTLGSINESFLVGYAGFQSIRNSKINQLESSSFDVDYSTFLPSSNDNIYLQTGIPQPQKYPPRFVMVDSIFNCNINYIGTFFNSTISTILTNIRDNSKLYSGSSIFTPSTNNTKIIVKNYLDEVVSLDAFVVIDSTGKVKYVKLSNNNQYPRYEESFRFEKSYGYYYFETTTTNEIGKVPSNIAERVKYIPTINNFDDSYSGYININNSNINELSSVCLSTIVKTNAGSITNSSIGLIVNSTINSFIGVSNNGRDDSRIIGCTFIGEVKDSTYSSMNNCYFKGNIYNSSFGENLGGGYGKLYGYNDGNLTSSDEFIFQDSQTGVITNPRSFTIDGNIFNADVVDATIGDYVEGNIFNCKINRNIPDYFSNNTVNILPIIYLSNNDYLSNFKELAERSIKCEINPIFKTFSELSVPVTVGRSFRYDQNENPTYFNMEAIVFRVEANYLDDISRIWFLIDNTRIAPDDPLTSNNDDSYLGESTVKPNTYETYRKLVTFGPEGRLVSGTSTLLGKSRDNTNKLRKDSNTYLTTPETLSTIVDNIALYQPGSYSYNPAYSQNLNHLSVPTKADLELIYSLNLIQRTDIVWSSSEIDANNAWAFNFATGQSVSRPKGTPLAFLGIIDSIGLNTMELLYKRNSGVITKQFPLNI